MSVYTKVEPSELEAFLSQYAIGQLVSYQGISDGIENTNYFVTTTGGRWVLTVFETVERHELPFFLDLMDHLNDHGIPSPGPVMNNLSVHLSEIKGKPAALVQRLSGSHVRGAPNRAQCAAMGEMMARMHIAAESFSMQRENPRGPAWWNRVTKIVLPKLAPDDAEMLQAELVYQDQFRTLELPRGIIHGDLFQDNALFEGDRLSGVIDFYYACTDALLFDLAIAVNDWCSKIDGALDEEKTQDTLQAYGKTRGFTTIEAQAWAPLLRAAALRFWLSRLHGVHFPRPGEITHTKDPDVFKRILQQRIAHPPKRFAG